MRIFVGVEDVGDAEFPHRDDKAVGGLAPGKLIDAGIYLLRLAAEIDSLADECPVNAHVGIIGSYLVSFRARKPGDAERPAEPEPLIKLRIDPEFRPCHSRKPR